jgi:hypothetical protein
MGNNHNKKILNQVRSTDKYVREEIPNILENVIEHKARIPSCEGLAMISRVRCYN